MKLALIVQRLRAQCPEFSNRVAGLAELADLEGSKTDFAVPHAFVVRLSDEPESSQEIGAGTQAMTESFGVVVCVSATSDPRGAAADDALDDRRDSILAALKGWQADGSHAAFEYLGFETLDVNRARVWRRFDFSQLTSI